MIEFSLIERNRVANNLFNNANFTIRAYSNTIGADGAGGTELTSAGYSAINITNDLTNFPTATNGTRSNAVEYYRDFTADGSISSIGIFNTATGEFLARKVYATPFLVTNGQRWRFAVGSITFTPTNP